MSLPDTPASRLDYDKFLSELKANGGNMAKAARAIGMSRESAYWRAKKDPEFKAKLKAVRDELSLQPEPTPEPAELPVVRPPAETDPAKLVPVFGEGAEKPTWQKQFETSLRTYGLVPIASIHAGVDYHAVEKLMSENAEFASRCRYLMDEANGQILLFARQRAMSGKADQVLLAWLKAYNDNFRDRASLQVSGSVKHTHGHIVLTPQMLEQVEKAEIARREFIEENAKVIEVKSEPAKEAV
jgi:hypothetical protein